MFKTSAFIVYLIAISALVNVPSFAQENIGFENGTFDNWDFAVGNVQTDGKLVIYPAFAVPGSFTIFKKEQADSKDYYGKFSVFPPNGSNYSMKLGNEMYGNTAQQISYTMTVPATGSNSIIFDYAVVLENPGHEPYQQPRFTVKIYNITDGKYIDCPAFDFISSSNSPGFKINSDGVSYKDWSSATINLTGLNDKKIRLEFTVNHCIFGEHFGYAYIDVNENINTPITGSNYCTNQATITLTAPPGFATYTWFTGDLKTQLGTGQKLTLPAPPDKTDLAVKVVPYDNLGCTDVLYTTVSKIDNDFKFVAPETLTGCPGSAVDLTKADITAGSSPGLAFEYLTESLQLISSPTDIKQGGLYYIKATNFAGCTDILPVKVIFEMPLLHIENPGPVAYPLTVDLSKSYTAQSGLTYSYYKDESATIPLANFNEIGAGGTYYIKAETVSGCANIQPVVVSILPSDPSFTRIPNTFSPNNDGINDRFYIPVDANTSFNNLQIYNRNGMLIFNTTNALQYWDGNYKGRPLTTGTYYWIFEGYDTYYRKKIKKSSYITLIR
jgi:gliding motility-associated-like protein